MSKFFYKLGLFILILILGWAVMYWALDLYMNKNNNQSNQTIYIWGDSQTALGIDVPLLSKLSGKNVLSASYQGNSVYNLLVFTERIPDNSTVIIGLSGPIQIRDKKTDYNESALSFTSLWELYKNNYSIKELLEIMYLNRTPQTLFSNESTLSPYNDTIVVFEPLEVFEKIYSSSPESLKDKQHLYFLAFKKLLDKKCKIILVEFPFHPKLEAIENKSKLKAETNKFENEVKSLLNINNVDTLILNAGKNPMVDFSHFNIVGADFMTSYINKSLLSIENNKFIKCINPQ